MSHFLTHLCALVLAVCLTGCRHAAETGKGAPLNRNLEVRNQGQVEPGDVITVHLSEIPGRSYPYALTVQVDSSGMMTLPGFEVTLVAAGKTFPSLAADIRDACVPRHFPSMTVRLEAIRRERPIRVGDDLIIRFTNVPP